MSSTVKRVILSRDSAIVFDTKTVILVSELNVEPFVSLETVIQGPRAVCIMSASGAVSTKTFHQDANSSSVVTYEINSLHTPASREEDTEASNKERVWVHILAADHRETLGRIRYSTAAELHECKTVQWPAQLMMGKFICPVQPCTNHIQHWLAGTYSTGELLHSQPALMYEL